MLLISSIVSTAHKLGMFSVASTRQVKVVVEVVVVAAVVVLLSVYQMFFVYNTKQEETSKAEKQH